MLVSSRQEKHTLAGGNFSSDERMLDAGANVLIFLADWHAWVNDKFDGVMEDIQTTATYMEETFRALLETHLKEREQVNYDSSGLRA